MSLSESLFSEEADPYSPRTLYGEESEKPVSREVFVAKTSGKKPALHSIEIEHTPPPVERKEENRKVLHRPEPELQEGNVLGFWGMKGEKKGGLSGVFEAVCLPECPERRRRLFKRTYSVFSDKCKDRRPEQPANTALTGTARRLLAGCSLIARALNPSNRRAP